MTKNKDFLDKKGFDIRKGEAIRPAEFARRMGADRRSVHQYLERGHVFRNKNGMLIWPHCKTDLESSRRLHVKQRAEGLIPTDISKKPPIKISREDLHNPELVQSLIAVFARQQDSALSGTYRFAKAFEQLLKVEKAQTAMLAERGDLIDRRAAEESLAAAARHKRNVWMDTPERIAAEFAKEAGIDHRRAYDLLTKHIHATLELIV